MIFGFVSFRRKTPAQTSKKIVSVGKVNHQTHRSQYFSSLLEIAFQLEANAGAGFKLYVFEANAGTKATQTHKITISLSPFVEKKKVSQSTNINQALIEKSHDLKMRTPKPKPSSSRPIVMKHEMEKVTTRRPSVKTNRGGRL